MNKDILAKLMATENILVEHQPVQTASFDVKERLLTLPLYSEKLGDDVVDLFVTHEIAHALYTPIVDDFGKVVTDKPELLDIAHSVINIIEDIRIEKRIKSKFPGGKKVFASGYKKLLDNDFFGTKNKDVNKNLNFLDRINLYFKGGIQSGIIFKDSKEIDIVKKLENIQTWEEVIEYSKLLLEYGKKLNQSGNGKNLLEGSFTQKQLDKKIQALQDTKKSQSRNYCNLPLVSDADLKNIVRPYQQILDDFDGLKVEVGPILSSLKKESNYLCNQFERHKAANTYEKTKFAKSGILNPTKLFKYRYSEDIFITNEIKPLGKNHGLVILIDFSSSMLKCIKNVIIQIFSILQFCKRQNIPFEVYGFTFNFNTRGFYDYIDPFENLENDKEIKVGKYQTVCQFLNSNMKLSEYNRGLEILLSIGRQDSIATVKRYTMGGTPLNHALMTMNTILKKFREKHNVDIMNFLTITDGGATDTLPRNLVIRNLNTKKTYNNENKSQALLEFLKDTYNMNSLGFYIGTPEQYTLSTLFGRNISSKEVLEHRKNINKDGFTIIKTPGYDQFYFVNKNIFSSEENNPYADYDTLSGYMKELIENNTNFKKKTLFLTKFIESFSKNL